MTLSGHEEARRQWRAAQAGPRMHHAWMLAGPRGLGKASFALQAARELVAERDVPQPPHDHPDVIVLEPLPATAEDEKKREEGKPYQTKRNITVEQIRAMQQRLTTRPTLGSRRAIVIDPADDLEKGAANALLKSLEEPPARTVFVLVAHSPGGLLPTIRSRCQVVRLNPLAPDELFSVLDGFDIGLPAGADERAALAAAAAGSPRSAILLTQYGGLEIASALDALLGADGVPIADAHRLADAVAARGQAIPFAMLNEHALDVLARAAAEAAADGRIERAGRLSEAWQKSHIAISETETYNLDRKQHALNMIFRLHDLLRM